MKSSKAVKKWILKAQDDLLWAQSGLQGKVYYGACFSCQQSAEKSLKAYLLSKGKIIRKVHYLGALIEESILFDNSFSELKETILPLIDYYVQTRYPDVGDFIDYGVIKPVDHRRLAKVFEKEGWYFSRWYSPRALSGDFSQNLALQSPPQF